MRISSVFSALLIIALCFISLPYANAEHKSADTYRQLILSGKFYIEYGVATMPSSSKVNKYYQEMDKYRNRILAVNGNQRVSLQNRSGKGFAPSILERDGKYYNFASIRSHRNNLTSKSTKEATMITKEQLTSGAVDTMEMWPQSISALYVPKIFIALLPNYNGEFDQFSASMSGGAVQVNANANQTSKGKIKSECIESGTTTLFNQKFNYDKYKVTNSAYGTAYYDTYILYYDGAGNLAYAETIPFHETVDGKSRVGAAMMPNGVVVTDPEALKELEKSRSSLPKQYIHFTKISDEIPPNIFDIPKGYKVYAADSASLEDLLGEKVLVEQY